MSTEEKEGVCLSCNQAGVDQTIANWANVSPDKITETTELNGLGGKIFPDIALANSLASLCPQNAKRILGNYTTWSIVADAEDDCLVREE